MAYAIPSKHQTVCYNWVSRDLARQILIKFALYWTLVYISLGCNAIWHRLCESLPYMYPNSLDVISICLKSCFWIYPPFQFAPSTNSHGTVVHPAGAYCVGVIASSVVSTLIRVVELNDFVICINITIRSGDKRRDFLTLVNSSISPIDYRYLGWAFCCSVSNLWKRRFTLYISTVMFAVICY